MRQHETNPCPINWWLWKGNCPAQVMDSVSAVMTHVMRESRDPGPGPYRQSSCKRPLGARPPRACSKWPKADPPPHRHSRLSTQPWVSPSLECPPSPPPLCLPTPIKAQFEFQIWPYSRPIASGPPVLLFISLCLCVLFPRTARSSGTESTLVLTSFS